VAPATVAVVGASEAPGSVGRAVMRNLLWNPFGGTLFPINPDCFAVLGVKAYPDLAAVPRAVELAILATPPAAIPNLLEQCAQAGVKGVILLSEAFREGDPARAGLEAQIQEQMRRSTLRVLGPNSMGVACSRSGFNATFAPRAIPPGKVGYISQSGSLLTALTSGSLPASIGCSTFLSVGSLIDVGWDDCLDYFTADPQTEQIGIYVEKPGAGPSFFQALRQAARHKPVLVVSGERKDASLEEMYRRAGVLLVETMADLFSVTEMVATQPMPRGRRLALLSNSRGPALVAANALLAEGGKLAPLATDTLTTLDRLLPAHGSHRNPIDVGDDANPELLAAAAEVVLRDPNSDALLVILTPQAAMDPARAAEALVPVVSASSKLVLVSWLWSAGSAAALATLHLAGIANFSCPNAAVRTFGYLCRLDENRRQLAEVAGR